jgi:hypothetical protein
MPYIPDLDALLTRGYAAEDDGTAFVVERHELGLARW